MIEDFFRVYIASCKHEGGWENLREFSQPPECLNEPIQTRKKFSIAIIKYL